VRCGLDSTGSVESIGGSFKKRGNQSAISIKGEDGFSSRTLLHGVKGRINNFVSRNNYSS